MKKTVSVIMTVVIMLAIVPAFVLNGALAAGDVMPVIAVVNEDGAPLYKESDENAETYDVTVPVDTVLEAERVFGSEKVWWAEVNYEGTAGYLLMRKEGSESNVMLCKETAESYIVTDETGIDFYIEDRISSELYDEKIPFETVISVAYTSSEEENDVSYNFCKFDYDGKSGYLLFSEIDENGEKLLGVDLLDNYINSKAKSKKTAVIIAAVIAAVLAVAVVAVIIIKKKKANTSPKAA